MKNILLEYSQIFLFVNTWRQKKKKGEIGIVKKDLTMSGDAMNTAARIRTQSGELNQKIIGSADFVTNIGLKDFQMESLGFIDLKGKKEALELFALKI